MAKIENLKRDRLGIYTLYIKYNTKLFHNFNSLDKTLKMWKIFLLQYTCNTLFLQNLHLYAKMPKNRKS